MSSKICIKYFKLLIITLIFVIKCFHVVSLEFLLPVHQVVHIYVLGASYDDGVHLGVVEALVTRMILLVYSSHFFEWHVWGWFTVWSLASESTA